MKHKDNLTDLVDEASNRKPTPNSDGVYQVTTDDGEVVTLGQQAVDNFLKGRENEGK